MNKQPKDRQYPLTLEVMRLKDFVTKHGGAAKLVRLTSECDKPLDASHISQILTGKRGFGERARRDFEKKLKLPDRYFDGMQDHVQNELERQLLMFFREMSEAHRDSLIAIANDYYRLDVPGIGVADPFNKRKKENAEQ